jgi:hypothetical protein
MSDPTDWTDHQWWPGLFRPLLHAIRDTETSIALHHGRAYFALCNSPVIAWSGPLPFSFICHRCAVLVGPAGLPINLCTPVRGRQDHQARYHQMPSYSLSLQC